VTDDNRRLRAQRPNDPRDGQFGRVPRDPYEEKGLRPNHVRPNNPPSNDPGRPPQGAASVSKPSTSSSSDSHED
jgi:hypothetical protein